MDCAPLDAAASTAPGPIDGVAVSFGVQTEISWASQGAGHRYDVVTVSLDGLRAMPQDDLSCLANNLAPDFAIDPRPDPPAGQGHAYLVRAQTRCGLGDYGLDASGEPRDAGTCP